MHGPVDEGISSSGTMPHPATIASHPHPRTPSHSMDFNQSDGARAGPHFQHSGYELLPLDSDPTTIYVSLRNPLNEPSFKPSPTKPIPRWMQLLRQGNQQQNEQEFQQEQTPKPPDLHRLPHPNPLPQESPEPQTQPYVGGPCFHITGRASSKGSQYTPEQPRTVVHAMSMPVLSGVVDTESESGDFQPMMMADNPLPLAPHLVTTASTRSKRDTLPISNYSPCTLSATRRCPSRSYDTTGKGKAPVRGLQHPLHSHCEPKHVS